MKKTRFLSLVLAVLMLAGMATLFSSCGKTEPGVITPAKDKVEVDLSDYAVLFGESQSGSKFTGTVRGQLDVFLAKLNAATGLKLKMKQADRVEIEKDAKEILIGATDREESQKAIKKIKGDGFIIEVLKNKIVLVGTNNLYTLMALDYFAESYLCGEEKSKTLSISENVKANEMTSVVLTNSGYKTEDIENAYTYVYKSGLGMIPGAYTTAGTDLTVPNYRELPMIVATSLTDEMASIGKLSQKHFPVGNDATVNEKEVLIGRTVREESLAALAEIDETQYIIAVRGERVVINAYSNFVLDQAASAYKELIREATVQDADGNTLVCLPRGFRLIGDATHSWQTDFPKPQGDGVELYNVMDNNDNSLQYLYRGTGVNKAAYDAYCTTLKNAGYKEVQSNAVEGSIFKFFTNKEKNSALYVAFNAYAHKDEFAEFDWTMIKQIDNQVIEPYGFETCIRIISSTIENAFLPDEELLSPSDYTYQNETSITSMPLYDGAVGHCYVVTLEDGSFIVYDGGSVNTDGAREYDMLWNLLCELNKRATGEETSSTNKVHIAAWILSHGHGDHIRAFKQMLEKYGKSGKLKMDYMIANLPSNEAYCSEDFEEVGNAMTPNAILKLQGAVSGGFKLIKPHTGMKFHLVNAELEIMTTWEDLNPWQTPNTNDTNTVIRMTFSSKNNDETTTMMWLGDANRLQSRFLCATFGTYMKSDMSTVAHHGNVGCEIDLYEMIDPETLFWTHHAKAAQDYLNPANATKGWRNQVDQYFTYQLASVKRVFANGGQMFTTGGETLMDEIAKGERPAQDGYMHLCFNGGSVDYDNVMELHFEYEKQNGAWVLQGTSMTTLAHTDISGGAADFEKNANGVMTFASNYMNKCDKGCPTGEHTH